MHASTRQRICIHIRTSGPCCAFDWLGLASWFATHLSVITVWHPFGDNYGYCMSQVDGSRGCGEGWREGRDGRRVENEREREREREREMVKTMRGDLVFMKMNVGSLRIFLYCLFPCVFPAGYKGQLNFLKFTLYFNNSCELFVSFHVQQGVLREHWLFCCLCILQTSPNNIATASSSSFKVPS